MFSVGDAVVYETQGVCKISEITSMTAGKVTREYYVLKPVYEDRSTVYVPVDNDAVVNSRMRFVFTVDEVNTIIKNVSDGNAMEWITDDAKRKEFCVNTLKKGDRAELMRLIGMLYSRQSELKEQKKHFHIADERYMKEAEKLINEEFAYVLGIDRKEVQNYIAKNIN
ncbi:MAG: CarD family transcriptional regulator [Ruminococcaceae bacterium]|nr:CarD family transcriptional regulator [Oscillospiraceae bacterium]